MRCWPNPRKFPDFAGAFLCTLLPACKRCTLAEPTAKNRVASRYVPTNQESVSPSALGHPQNSRDDGLSGRAVRNLPRAPAGLGFQARHGGFQPSPWSEISTVTSGALRRSETPGGLRTSRSPRTAHRAAHGTSAERASGFRPLARPSRRGRATAPGERGAAEVEELLLF